MKSFKFAKFFPNGRKEYYLVASNDGVVYGIAYFRDNGPAIITEKGIEIYYSSGKKVREVHPNGYEENYINNKLGKKDGPTIIYPTGGEDWYLDGEFHREDGPARKFPDGTVQYYYEGKLIFAKNDKDFNRRVSLLKAF